MSIQFDNQLDHLLPNTKQRKAAITNDNPVTLLMLNACDAVPTHAKGHILDAVITKSNDSVICCKALVSDPAIGNKHGHLSCDHLAVTVIIDVQPKRVRERVSFRKLRDISVSDFAKAIQNCSDLADTAASHDKLVKTYAACTNRLLNEHGPLHHRTMPL